MRKVFWTNDITTKLNCANSGAIASTLYINCIVTIDRKFVGISIANVLIVVVVDVNQTWLRCGGYFAVQIIIFIINMRVNLFSCALTIF